MKKESMLFIILTFLFFSLSFSSQVIAAATPDPDISNEEAMHIGNNLSIAPVYKKIADRASKSMIKISYPQIIGKKLSPSAMKFNSTMQEMINREIQQFKQATMENLIHMQKQLPTDMKKSSLVIDYDMDVVHPNHDTIISVRLNIEGMQAGSAHPYHNHQVLNYDLNQNKTLTLNDIFKPNSPYLKFIAAYSQKKINDHLENNWANKGANADLNNYRTWNIQNDTLLITFDEYQVAPYASGPQEVEIPYSDLKKMMSPTSALYSCAENTENCARG